MPRYKWLIISSSLISGLLIVFLFGDVTKSSAFGIFSIGMEKRLEKACHRAIAKRAPLGHRDIETTAYSVDDDGVGMAEGLMMARHNQSSWTKVAWSCHIKPRSGLVVHSEVKAAGGHRKAFFK